MSKILLDTSILIDFLRRKDKENSLFFKLVQGKYQFYASIITHTELHAGKSIWEKPAAQKELGVLFSGIQLLPLDEEISKQAGRIKAIYNLNLFDAIIAASTLSSKLELATLNISDFKAVRDLKIYNPKV